MLINDAKSLFDQQSGFSYWRSSNAPVRRLRCSKDNSYSQLLPQTDQDEFNRDTPIFTCKFAPQEGNEHLLALANEDGKLAIHDSESNIRYGIHAHNNAIFDLAWMFDKMKLVTASGDHTSKIYDVGNGDIRVERMFCGHTRSVKTVGFRKNDSCVFATGGRDGNIILWDTRTDTSSFIGKADGIISNSHTTRVFTPSKSRRKYNTPTMSGIKSVTGLVFQDANTLISCGAGDGILKIWDLRKNYTVHRKDAAPKSTISYPGNTNKKGYSSLIIDNEGIRLYANCLDNTIYCYNVGTYETEPVMRYTGHQNNTFYVKSALGNNGTYLISGSSDENAYIWNTKVSKPIVKLTGHSAEVTCVSWCDKNYHLVTCSDDITHKIWTVQPEELPDDWEINGRGIAEVLPLEKIENKVNLKRILEEYEESTPKKLSIECPRCNKATTTKSCKNCASTLSKRKNSCEQTEFGPRRLFADVSNPQSSCGHSLADSLDNKGSTDYEPTIKLLKLLDFPTNYQENRCANTCGSDEVLSCRDTNVENCEPPCKLAKLEISPGKSHTNITSSPTVNLPNYVVDGSAPHLNYSPPKKKSQDWLTRIRVEKRLRQEMYDKTVGASTPKMTRHDNHSKNKKYLSDRSPILRYFKVTNSPHKCDVSCSKYHNCSSNQDRWPDLEKSD